MKYDTYLIKLKLHYLHEEQSFTIIHHPVVQNAALSPDSSCLCDVIGELERGHKNLLNDAYRHLVSRRSTPLIRFSPCKLGQGPNCYDALKWKFEHSSIKLFTSMYRLFLPLLRKREQPRLHITCEWCLLL